MTVRRRAYAWVAMVCAAACSIAVAQAQGGTDGFRPPKEHALPDRFPDKPSLAPSFSISVTPLGFNAPGALYLGSRNSLVSLDFIDENRLLFTFHVPGLIHRRFLAGESAESDERQIRAIVLALPAGTLEAEGLWTVHDRVRYLWMLKDGHFLLRDRDGLQLGDATLDMKPSLRFPGPLLWVELDPSQQYLVTNSYEPSSSQGKAVEAASPASATITMDADEQRSEGQDNAEPPERVVRILRRESGKVMLVSRVRSTVHLPINSEGYLENLRGRGLEWVLNLNYFSGGSRILGQIDSTCVPSSEFISEKLVLVSACNTTGSRKLEAITTSGRILWQDVNPDTAIWPLIAHSPDGLRLAQETLAISHRVTASNPISREDVKGQLVRIFNAATGEVALETPASPALDSGGNVAISPSGRRVAVLNAGVIQVFDLPAPPALPDVPLEPVDH